MLNIQLITALTAFRVGAWHGKRPDLTGNPSGPAATIDEFLAQATKAWSRGEVLAGWVQFFSPLVLGEQRRLSGDREPLGQ